MKTQITSFETACEYLKYDPATCLPNVETVPEIDREYLVTHEKLVIIARAINTEYGLANGLGKCWIPNFEDKKQRKYYSWFIYRPGSPGRLGRFVYSAALYVYGAAYAIGGPRFYFPTEELAKYFYSGMEQFVELHAQEKSYSLPEEKSEEAFVGKQVTMIIENKKYNVQIISEEK